MDKNYFYLNKFFLKKISKSESLIRIRVNEKIAYLENNFKDITLINK